MGLYPINNHMKSSNDMSVLRARVEKLEKAVFGSKGKKIIPSAQQSNFKGTKGGVLLLISKGYLNKRRTAPEVLAELEKNDYYYRIQVVQTTLNRLSSLKGPLTALAVNGQKVYVKRK
jgi:hypothetical protein